jgi:hypothetical protein
LEATLVTRKVNRRRARLDELTEELCIGAAMRLRCESESIHDVVKAVVDYLTEEYPAQDLYIPAGIVPEAYPVAAMKAAMASGESVRKICQRFQIRRQTLYRLVGTK